MYLDTVIASTRGTLVAVAILTCIVAVILWLMRAADASQDCRSSDKLTTHCWAWTIVGLVSLILACMFPADSRQWHELEALAARLGSVMAWKYIVIGTFCAIGYGVLCWWMPLDIPMTRGGQIRAVIGCHLGAVLVAGLLWLCNEDDKRLKKEKDKALREDIRQIVAEYVKEPGFKCTIDKNTITVEKK